MSFTELQKEGLLNAMRSDPIAVSDVMAEICAEIRIDIWQASEKDVDFKENSALLEALKSQYFTLEPTQYEERLRVFDDIDALRKKCRQMLNG